MRYSTYMRRNLDAGATIAVICSLLWAVSGVSVSAVALHEHVHHAESHDHHDAIRTALHGHAHESPADHEHDLSMLVSTSRISTAHHVQASASQIPHSEHYSESPIQLGIATEPNVRDVGPPSYVMHCVLLT
jgi:hypothetical protein